MLLMAILLFVQPPVAVVFAVIGFAANIWLLVVQVLFSRKFNQIYMRHVEQKLEQNDLRADPSVIRLVIAGVISAAVTTVLETLIMAATMGEMLGGMMFMGGQSGVDRLDIDWSSYMEDMDVDDYGILEDEARDAMVLRHIFNCCLWMGMESCLQPASEYPGMRHMWI